MRQTSLSLATLFFFLQSRLCLAANFGIPGTTATNSGYDTELGKDAICWRSKAAVGSTSALAFPNPIVEDFRLDGTVELLTDCPVGNRIEATAPWELLSGEIMRTEIEYFFNVTAHINLTSLGMSHVVADDGPVVAFQILQCALGDSGFCSPFIHEEANARLAANGETETVELGDRHGGTHVHSSYVKVLLLPEDGPLYELHVTVPVQINQPGQFFGIAATQIYLSDTAQGLAQLRYDMANALPRDQRLLDYYAPPVILDVEPAVLIVSYVGIALVACFISFLLFQTIKHRNHRVLRMTQGHFLIVFLLAALTATLGASLQQATKSWYCQAAPPIVFCSLQCMSAITIGRLWRIHAVVSPLLARKLQPNKASWFRLFRDGWNRLFNAGRQDALAQGRKSRKLRTQVSAWQLTAVVVLFTMPQVVIQILALTLQPAERMIEFNQDETKGRAMCSSGHPWRANLRAYGFVIFALLIVLLLAMAHATRSLPSLLNETHIIYESTLNTFIFMIVCIGIAFLANDPSTTPSLPYLGWVGLTLSITLTTSYRIMMPKLRMIWRGETILVSKLVSGQTRSSSDELRLSRRHVMVSGLEPEAAPIPQSSRKVLRHADSGVSIALDDESVSSSDEEDGVVTTTVDLGMSQQSVSECPTDELHSSFPSPPPPPRTMLTEQVSGGTKRRLVREFPSFHSETKRAGGRRIVIREDQTPTRRLLLKMLDMQQHLNAMNNRVISGRAVPREDWKLLRTLSSNMGMTFDDEVQFAWEQEESSGLISSTPFEKSMIMETDGENGGEAA